MIWASGLPGVPPKRATAIKEMVRMIGEGFAAEGDCPDDDHLVVTVVWMIVLPFRKSCQVETNIFVL